MSKVAAAGRLTGVDVNALHDGHDLWSCFKKCRGIWYTGVSDVDEEEKRFAQMLEAVKSSSSHQTTSRSSIRC